MTTQTLRKAEAIFKGGGVERTGPSSYRVTSTSGETYAVFTNPSYCSHPRQRDLDDHIDGHSCVCSHKAAVDLAVAKRERIKAEA